MHDVLVLFDRFTPSFVKKYADLFSEMERAFKQYISDVKERRFPAAEHSISMDPQALRDLIREIEMQGFEFDSDDAQPPRLH